MSDQSLRIAAVIWLALPAMAEDARQKVDLPETMRAHLLANMRDHLAALTQIQAALGRGDYDAAAEVAERRLGMSSLAAHGAEHMAPYMPPAMKGIGSEMHRAASRFARTAQESAVEGDLKRPFAALSQVGEQCVACHAAFRIHFPDPLSHP